MGWRPTEFRYEYDRVGNRLSKETLVDSVLTELVDYAYDDNDWLLTETHGSDVTSYQYNANGSQVRKRVNAVDAVINEWDQQGRLVAVSFDDDADGVVDRAVTYKHDDGGLRVSRTENGVETRRVWDHSLPYGQVVAEYVAGDADKTVRFTFGLQVISQERVPYSGADPATYFYYQDGHSGVRQMAQAHPASLLLWDSYTYDAFGVHLNPAFSSTPNARLYRGEVRDPLTGDYDLRARGYSPEMGRFTSVDPFDGILTNPITRHRFLYAGADPVNNSDPTGMFLTGGLSFGGLLGSVAMRGVATGAAVTAGTAAASSFGYWWVGASPLKGFVVGAQVGTALSVVYSLEGGWNGVLKASLRGLWGGAIKWMLSAIDHWGNNTWNTYTYSDMFIDFYEGYAATVWSYAFSEFLDQRVSFDRGLQDLGVYEEFIEGGLTLLFNITTQSINGGIDVINGKADHGEFIHDLIENVLPPFIMGKYLDKALIVKGYTDPSSRAIFKTLVGGTIVGAFKSIANRFD